MHIESLVPASLIIIGTVIRFKVGFYSQEYRIITGFSVIYNSHTFKGLYYPLRTNWLVAYKVTVPISYNSQLILIQSTNHNTYAIAMQTFKYDKSNSTPG